MENFNQYPVGIERVLTASEFMLFCTMYNQWRLMKNEKEYYFRSFEDLSDDCTLSLRSIKTIVKEFKNKGILESVAGSKKKGHANEYRFNLSAIFALIHNDDSDEIKVQNMSNKSANSAHHKEIKTKENNVKYIHISGISSNEDESNKIKNNNIISSEDKMDRMETVNEEKIEDLNVMNDTMKNNNFTSDVEAMQTDTTEISDTSKNINISDTESIEVVNEESNSVANVMNDDDNNTKDNNMIQDKTTDSSVGPDNIEGENESMNVENTEMNDTMKNNIPSEDTMKNKSIATTSIHLSVSNTTKNHEGSAAVGGGAENLRNGAGSVNSSTMDNYTTSTEKSVNTAPLYSNTASNGKVNMFYLQHGITQEEYEEAQRSFMPNSWKNLTVHGIKIDNKTVTFTEVLNKLYSTTEIQISLTWWSKMCTTAKQYVHEGKMTASEYIKLRDEIIRLIEAKAKNIWYNTFKKYNNERNAFTYNNYIRKAWTITKNVISDDQKKSFTEEILNIN